MLRENIIKEGSIIKDVENFLNWDVEGCYANINRELEGELELYMRKVIILVLNVS